MRRVWLIAFLLFTIGKLQAQFNDSTFYQIRYATTGIVNRTNDASSYNLANNLRFSMSRKSVVLNSTNNWVYGRQQQRMTNNDFNSALDLNWYRKNKQFYYWGLGNYQSSFSLKVKNRSQVGFGVAYSFVDRANAFINLSNGLLYEFSEIKVNDSTNEVYGTTRNSFRFRFRFAHNNLIVFDGVSFIQNSLQYKNDYILTSNTNLSVKLNKWLSLVTSATFNRLSKTNRENLLLTYGVVVEKFF